MFPNDDICNLKAAKNAARRIFQKYSSSQQNPTRGGIGKTEVSSLIKNAYGAINIDYDPSKQDVSSFMEVFGTSENESIDLSKLQELAVKFLCGESSLQKPQNQKILSNSSNTSKQGVNFQKLEQQQPSTPIQPQIRSQLPLQLNTIQVQKKDVQINVENKIKKLQYKYVSNPGFLSPKFVHTNGNWFSKQNPVKQYQKVVQKENKNLNECEVMREANLVFEKYKNQEKNGITTKQAKDVLQKSYQLIGRTAYKPAQQDVKIWMKLCDTKGNGVVNWSSYQNFIQRLLQSESKVLSETLLGQHILTITKQDKVKNLFFDFVFSKQFARMNSF